MNPENQIASTTRTEQFTRWMFWAAAIVVLALALAPMQPRSMPDFGSDKINHCLAFATLALLGRAAYPRHLLALLAGLMAYGGLIEILQSFTATRNAEWGDLLADAAGLGVGTLFAGFVRWSMARRAA